MEQFSTASEWRIKMPKLKGEISPTTRIAVRLEALRNKQHAVLKKLKLMKNARRKFDFTDVELKNDLTDRQRDKELLLHLIAEKKRFHEKCFFAEVATKKCQVMMDFFSGITERLIEVMEQTSHVSSNSEAEQRLNSFQGEITARLDEAQQKLLNQKKAVSKKSKDTSELEYAVNKGKMEDDKILSSLKTKLAKGDILSDQEILRLSLGTCVDTNTRLAAAVQSYGQQSDELREKFFWKRDDFVTQLAKDHQKMLTKLFAPKIG